MVEQKCPLLGGERGQREVVVEKKVGPSTSPKWAKNRVCVIQERKKITAVVRVHKEKENDTASTLKGEKE